MSGAGVLRLSPARAGGLGGGGGRGPSARGATPWLAAGKAGGGGSTAPCLLALPKEAALGKGGGGGRASPSSATPLLMLVPAALAGSFWPGADGAEDAFTSLDAPPLKVAVRGRDTPVVVPDDGTR